VAGRRYPSRDVDGIVLLDKPGGLTSNQALQRTKRLFMASKAGHTGSLDPLATGMLPICLGQATKVSGFLLDAAKHYLVACQLGSATDTGDSDGTVIQRREGPPVEQSVLEAALEKFMGPQQQVPPMYSALKHRGQPLYKLARKGIEIERKPRTITVHALQLDSYAWPEFRCLVHCSKGTYVRTLVADIAAALGTLGHVTALRRLSVGPFEGARMLTLEELESDAQLGMQTLDRHLLPSDAALPDWPLVELDAAAASKLIQGQKLPLNPDLMPGAVRVYGPERRFLGVADVGEGGQLVARRLFVS
jgi:tRNA pseudouridine55 synthase